MGESRRRLVAPWSLTMEGGSAIVIPMTMVLWVVAAVLVLVGVAGTFLPALPGTLLVFAGLFLAAWADGFARVGWPALLLLGLLTVFSYAVDLVATAVGARRFGASRRAAVGAVLGTLLGLFFGLPGLIIGPFAGAVVGEIWARNGFEGAAQAGIGAWLGFVVGAAAKLGIVFAMVGLFVAALFL